MKINPLLHIRCEIPALFSWQLNNTSIRFIIDTLNGGPYETRQKSTLLSINDNYPFYYYSCSIILDDRVRSDGTTHTDAFSWSDTDTRTNGISIDSFHIGRLWRTKISEDRTYPQTTWWRYSWCKPEISEKQFVSKIKILRERKESLWIPIIIHLKNHAAFGLLASDTCHLHEKMHLGLVASVT